MRRESYSNRFATALEGVDLDNPGVAIDRTGHETRFRASSGRSCARARSRCATSSSSARPPTGRSGSPCRAPSPWRAVVHAPLPRDEGRLLARRRRDRRRPDRGRRGLRLRQSPGDRRMRRVARAVARRPHRRRRVPPRAAHGHLVGVRLRRRRRRLRALGRPRKARGTPRLQSPGRGCAGRRRALRVGRLPLRLGGRPVHLDRGGSGLRRAGFPDLKIRLGTAWEWDGVGPGRFLALLEDAVDAVGGRIAIAVDANQRLDLATAVEVGRGLDRLGCAWFEEPIPQDDIDGYVRLAAELDLPVTGGAVHDAGALPAVPGTTRLRRRPAGRRLVRADGGADDCGGRRASRPPGDAAQLAQRGDDPRERAPRCLARGAAAP